jgi:hypothetical protein
MDRSSGAHQAQSPEKTTATKTAVHARRRLRRGDTSAFGRIKEQRFVVRTGSGIA